MGEEKDCAICGNSFDPYVSDYDDICDECAEEEYAEYGDEKEEES